MRFWIAAAVLLGLAALGLTTVPRMIDWGAYRADIEAQAARHSGHDVTIGGPIEISLLPRPVLTARDVTVTGTADQAIGFALNIAEAEVTMEIGPLLAGRPVVRDLKLQRPALAIDGESSRRLRSWPPRWQGWAAPFAKLDLESISIVGGEIALESDRSDQPIGLSDLSLQLLFRGPDGPLEAEGLFKTRRHRFTMTAAFGRPDKDGVSASKLLIEAQNGIDEVTTLRFNGRVEAQGLDGRLTLAGPDLQHGLAAIAAAGGYPSTFRSIEETQPFALEGRVNADRTGIRSEDLQLKLSKKLGKGRIDLQLHPRLRLDLDAKLPTLRLARRADLKSILPLGLPSELQVPPGRIEIDLRELLYRGEAARQASVKLETGQDGVTMVEQAKVQLPGLVDMQFEGKLHAGNAGPRLTGRLAAVGDNLKSSLSWLGLVDTDDQSEGWRSFSLEGEVDASSTGIALSALDMRLDSSKLGGKAGLHLGERRRLSLDVDVERLNLDLYGSDISARDAVIGLLERLEGLDADIETRFERLIWQGVHVEQGSISASADEGRLALGEIVASSVGDTSVSLEGTIDLERGSVDLGATLQSEHPARALHHLELDLPLSSGRLQSVELAGGIRGTLERLTVDLEAGYDQGQAMIKGQGGWIEEQPWYDLEIDARHPDHQALASQLGLAPLVPAGDAEGPLELTVKLRRESAKPWSAAGNAKLGPTTVTGSLTYETNAGTGPFEAKLSVGTPRKDSLAPFLALTGRRLPGGWTPDRWLGRLPSYGLRTAWLDEAEGTLSLASKGGLAGDGLSFDAKLADGLLYIDRIVAQPWQGRLAAELSLERRRDQPFLAIAVDLEDVQAAELAKWLGVKNGIDGPLDLRMEASSAGRTPFDMIAGLAGEVAIKAGPGEINGLGIPDLRRTVVTDEGADPPTGRSLSLPFSAIDVEAKLGRGILTIEDGRLLLDPRSGREVETTIDGTVDLLLWVADLTLRSRTEGDADDTRPVFRVVGPPGQPAGYRSSEN